MWRLAVCFLKNKKKNPEYFGRRRISADKSIQVLWSALHDVTRHDTTRLVAAWAVRRFRLLSY